MIPTPVMLVRSPSSNQRHLWGKIRIVLRCGPEIENIRCRGSIRAILPASIQAQ